jgi:hypothetical protein
VMLAARGWGSCSHQQCVQAVAEHTRNCAMRKARMKTQ